MLKLFLCLVSSLLLAVIMLQMRQQRLELNYQLNRLHMQIESQQAKLWSQQRNIAIETAPNAILRTVGTHDLNLVVRPAVPTPDVSTASINLDAE